MGIFVALNQLAGSLSPLGASWIYKDYGTYWAFSCSMMLSMFAAILNVVFYNRFQYKTRIPYSSSATIK